MDGRIEVSSVSANGTRTFHATVDTPQFVGELGPLGDLPRTASLIALTDSEVWTAPGDGFVAFITTEPAASLAVITALTRQIQSHQAFVEDLLFLDLKGQGRQATPPDGHSGPRRAPRRTAPSFPEVTQADLASLCGGSRENVTRILKEFERRGIVRATVIATSCARSPRSRTIADL